ncbi:MAG: hypothetical protein K2H53_04605 [Clostridia bacterium]|nr:hypothetical protein [Clostridia bacterium]
MKEKYKKECGEDELQMFFVSQEIEDDTVKEYLNDILFGVSNNEEKINRINRRKFKGKVDNR